MQRREFIAFLDDDDVWLPTNIVRNVEILKAQPRVDVVFGKVVTADVMLKPQGEPWPAAGAYGDKLVHDMLSGYYPQLGATVVRSKAAREIGLFDEKLLGDQDWDWQLRLARRRRTAASR